MLAVLPVGRVGSLFSCVSSLSFALFCLLLSPPPSSFHLPAYPAHPRPFSPWPSLPLSPHRHRSLSLSLTRVVVRLFYYFYKCRRHTMLLLASARPVAAAVSFVGPPWLHCCSQKDANFNLILSNIIYVCTRLEKPRTFFENCRAVAS